MKKKGIILAGGNGSRLYPSTSYISKQLLLVYDKPLVFNAVATLLLAGIRDINLVSKQMFLPHFQQILGDGSKFGVNISYSSQDVPGGIPEVYKICESFLANSHSVMVLGDNIFHGSNLSARLEEATQNSDPTIFVKSIPDPTAFGVAEIDDKGTVLSLEEKPTQPKSDFAVLGLYFLDNDAPSLAKELKPSKRGETEIIDLLIEYNKIKNISVNALGRGDFWTDAGTPDSIQAAGNFFQTLQKNTGLLINCPEEIAWRKGFITETEFERLIKSMPASNYRECLEKLLTKATGFK